MKVTCQMLYTNDFVHRHIIYIIILNIHSVTFSESCYSLVISFIQMFLHLLILQQSLSAIHLFIHLSLSPSNQYIHEVINSSDYMVYYYVVLMNTNKENSLTCVVYSVHNCNKCTSDLIMTLLCTYIVITICVIQACLAS